MSLEKYQELEDVASKIIVDTNELISRYEDRVLKDVDNIKLKNKYVENYLKTKENTLIRLGNSNLESVRKQADKLKEDYDRLRKSTVPYNYLWFWFLKRKQYRNLPLSMQRGVHFVVALMGGGKSSFIYHTIERLRHEFGYGAYVNVDIEFPHYDQVLNEHVLFHKRFEQEDFWGASFDEENEKVEFKQLKQFNNFYPVLVLDEWLAKMNHRMNNTAAYKEMFIPFMRSLAHMRHQGIHHVYVASQLDNTDIQLMGLVKYMHEVEIDLDIDYWTWVKTGKLDKHVQGWTVYTYVFKKKKGKPDKILKKKWYEPKIMDMTNFNSLNQASEYSGLPLDKIQIKRSYA